MRALKNASNTEYALKYPFYGVEGRNSFAYLQFDYSVATLITNRSRR